MRAFGIKRFGGGLSAVVRNYPVQVVAVSASCFFFHPWVFSRQSRPLVSPTLAIIHKLGTAVP